MMNEIKNKKTIFSVVVIAILLIGVVGLTYAFFNYTRTGAANNIGTGRIYFNMVQNGAINMTNIFPMTSQEASNAELDSVVVRIAGDTTYSGGEEFEISLTDVTNTINGKKMPINYIATYTAANGKSVGEESNDYWNARNSKNADIYTLTETGKVEDGKQVLVGYIKNSASGIEGTLTIKAYIDADRIAISDTYDGTESDNMGTTSALIRGRTVFTTTEWNQLQGANGISFKIRAESNEGIWVERESTPASCFKTTEPKMIYYLNNNMTSEELNSCINYFSDSGYRLDSTVTYEQFCRGTGTHYNSTLLELVNSEQFDESQMNELQTRNIILTTNEYGTSLVGYDSSCGSDVVIPSKLNIQTKSYVHNNSMTSDEVNACIDYFENIGWSVDTSNGETLESFCDGSGTMWENTFQQMIDYGNYFSGEQVEALIDRNIIIENVETFNNVRIVSIDGEYSEYYDDHIGAFESKNITSIIIQNGVTNIDSKAFYNNQLTSVEIPSSVTRIGSSAFYNNQLTSVEIPSSVTKIGSRAFSGNQLTSVKIPSGINIGIGAFSDNQLTSLEIPNGAIIGDNAFLNNSITTLTINTDNVKGERLTICRKSYPDRIGIKSVPNIILGDNVNTIGVCAFFSLQLRNVIMSNSVTTIEYGAFSNNLLENITLGSGVTTIRSNSFDSNHLQSLVVPDSVTIIDSDAFSNNSITNLYLGEGITHIETSVGTTGVGKMSYRALDWSNITYFDKVNINYNFFVSGSGLEPVKFGSSLTLGSHVETIGSSAFQTCKGLNSITIGSNVSLIGINAFEKYYVDGNTSNVDLHSININKSCSEIKSMADYPWLGDSYKLGTTIYGANNEVCDSW